MFKQTSQSNFWLCAALEYLWATYYGVAVTVEWYKQFGIQPTQIMILQVIMGAATVLFDIPCGWLADRFGVRRVMVTGICLQIIQSTIFGLCCTKFWQFSIMLAITGIAWSFTSGTAKAIVMATVPGRAHEYPKRSVQARSLGQLTGITVGTILVARFGVRAPFAIQWIPFVVALIIALRLVDSQVVKQRVAHPKLSSVLDIGKKMFIDRPDIRWIVLLSATANAAVLAMAWLVQPDLQAAGVSVKVFGFVFAVRTVGTAIFAHFSDKFAAFFGEHGAQIVLITLIVVCALFAGLHPGLSGAIVVLICGAVVTAFAESLMTKAINLHMPEVRTQSTTVYSISTAAQSVLFAVSPLMALINDQVSTSAAYIFVSCLTAAFGGFGLYKYKHALLHAKHQRLALVV